MGEQERLALYDKVNRCETFQELADAILLAADENGQIQGRSKKFSAKKMAHAALAFGVIQPNTLTREFGIRQQAFYIDYYS